MKLREALLLIEETRAGGSKDGLMLSTRSSALQEKTFFFNIRCCVTKKQEQICICVRLNFLGHKSKELGNIAGVP